MMTMIAFGLTGLLAVVMGTMFTNMGKMKAGLEYGMELANFQGFFGAQMLGNQCGTRFTGLNLSAASTDFAGNADITQILNGFPTTFNVDLIKVELPSPPSGVPESVVGNVTFETSSPVTDMIGLQNRRRVFPGVAFNLDASGDIVGCGGGGSNVSGGGYVPPGVPNNIGSNWDMYMVMGSTSTSDASFVGGVLRKAPNGDIEAMLNSASGFHIETSDLTSTQICTTPGDPEYNLCASMSGSDVILEMGSNVRAFAFPVK